MAIKIVLKTVNDAYLFKDQVSSQGLVVDQDYTWRYTPAVFNWLGDETITPATVEFNFKEDQWTTYFQLKWGV